MSERFRSCVAHPEYEVSDLGRVRRIGPSRGARVGRVLALHRRPDGRVCVRLHSRDRARTHLVHRLVLEAFAGPCPPGHECNHINGDPSDNRLVNLEWVTHDKNVSHAYAHGLKLPCGPRGERHPSAKLSDEDRLAVLSSPQSHAELARKYGVTRQAIYQIRKGTRSA